MNPAADKARAVAHYTEQAALAAALNLSRTLENATLWPWVLKLTYTLAGGQVTSTHMSLLATWAASAVLDDRDDNGGAA